MAYGPSEPRLQWSSGFFARAVRTFVCGRALTHARSSGFRVGWFEGSDRGFEFWDLSLGRAHVRVSGDSLVPEDRKAEPNKGFPKLGVSFWCPYNLDYSIWGSILGPLVGEMPDDWHFGLRMPSME